MNLPFRGLGGKIRLQNRELRLLLGGEILPVCLLELFDRLLPLPHEALQHLDRLGVVEGGFLVDFPVLQGGLGHAQGARAGRILRLHGSGEILAQLLDDIHTTKDNGAGPPRQRDDPPSDSRYPSDRESPGDPDLSYWLLAAALAFSPQVAEPPLARLARLFGAELVRASEGRPIEVRAPLDRTGRGLALDLKTLLLARLEGHLGEAGSHVQVTPVLSETPERLVVSGRLVAEPSGDLVDILSTSVEKDETLIALFPTAPPSTGALDLVSMNRTPLLEGPLLDVAFLSAERIAILTPETVSVYRPESTGLSLESRGELPGPSLVVRRPAGIPFPGDGDTLWALTNRSPRATLYALEGRQVVKRGEAQALPWPGAPRGLLYRPGTDLLEGPVEGLGAGPFLALSRGGERVAVSPEGGLITLGGVDESGVRVGPTLAWPFPGILVASSAAPPGEADALVFFELHEGALSVLEPVPVQGSVRALAARRGGETAHLVAAVEEKGRDYLLSVDLRRREP